MLVRVRPLRLYLGGFVSSLPPWPPVRDTKLLAGTALNPVDFQVIRRGRKKKGSWLRKLGRLWDRLGTWQFTDF